MAWIHFETLQGRFRKSVQNENLMVATYMIVGEMVKYGKNMIDKELGQSDGRLSVPIKSDLAEWQKIQGDLSYLYTRLVNARRE